MQIVCHENQKIKNACLNNATLRKVIRKLSWNIILNRKTN